jgi:ATP-dependent Lhr-like helicase
VLVTPAPGQPGKMPFWHGESAGRPLEFGRAIGALSREVRSVSRPKAIARLRDRHCLDDDAARALLDYLDAQEDAGAVPDDRTIVVEACRDEMGEWRVCILSPFGSRVHAPWAMAIGAMVRDRTDVEPDILWMDDGIVLRFPDLEEPPPVDWLIPDADEVEGLVVRQLGAGGGGARQVHLGAPVNALFASRFREAAARALLIPRRHPGQRAPLWQQRKRAADLLHVTARYGDFPIILETYRECLRDVFDMPALRELLGQVRDGEVEVASVTTPAPSPFASALLFHYVANFMYEGDAPLAERRAQALMVDPAQLRELLGDADLRLLLDPDAIETLERSLQHLTPERAARHADGLHDLLLRLGDLSDDEVRARCASPGEADAWREQLQKQGRIVRVTVAGGERSIAVEEAGRYRDALGTALPPGLPDAFLEPVPDALTDLLGRYARTHGPFTEAAAAARFGIGVSAVRMVLQEMAARGRVLEGEFLPNRTGREWCDTEVLRAIRQRSLARVRRDVEPVEQSALGRLLLDWHGIRPAGESDRRPVQLLEVIARLQGAAIPASELESAVLRARLPAYDPRELDLLLATGQALWVGREPLGQHDGRVSLYLTEDAPRLLPPPGEGPDGPVHDAIRAHLRARGASFYPAILQTVGGMPREVLEALWALVWSGEVTNDTLQPLRAFQNEHRTGVLPRPRGYGAGGRRPRMVVRGFQPASRMGDLPGAGSAAVLPEAAGRWSLVSGIVFGEPTVTERLAARARMLLERHGVVTREAAQAEGLEGGFSAVYGVLKAMEEAGRVRRGYFVTGLGMTQFAAPEAVERLRALRDPEDALSPVWLAATDPANPYGAALPWPAREAAEGRRPMRAAGTSVLLLNGALAAWTTREGRTVLTFVESAARELPGVTADELRGAIAAALAGGTGRAGSRLPFVEEVDGAPTHRTLMAEPLVRAGFSRSTKGFLRR